MKKFEFALQDYRNCLADNAKNHPTELQQVKDFLTKYLSQTHFKHVENFKEFLRTMIPEHAFKDVKLSYDKIFSPEACLLKIAKQVNIGDTNKDYFDTFINENVNSSLRPSLDNGNLTIYLKASDTNNIFAVNTIELQMSDSEVFDLYVTDKFKLSPWDILVNERVITFDSE